MAPHQILNQKIATRWISCLLFINSCSSGPPFLQYLPMFLRVLQYLQELLPNRFPTAFGPPKVLQQDSKMTPGASQDDPKVVPRAPKTGSRDPKIGPRDHTIAPRGLLGDSWTSLEHLWVALHQILNQKIASRWISCLLFINSCSSEPPFLQYLPMFLRALQYLQTSLPKRFPSAFGPPKVLRHSSKIIPRASQDTPKRTPRVAKTGPRAATIAPRDSKIGPKGHSELSRVPKNSPRGHSEVPRALQDF